VLTERSQLLRQDEALRKDFVFELRRFLPIDLVELTIENPDFWTVVVDHVQRGCAKIISTMATDV